MARLASLSRRFLAAALITVGAGVVAVPPAQPASAYTTIYYNGAGANAPTVGLIGDSSFAGVRWLSSYAPLKRFNFALDAESCRRTILASCRGREGYAPANALTTLKRLQGRFDDVLVMVTGYNDPGYNFAAAVDRIMAEAIRQRIGKVVWLTMRTASVTYVSPEFRSNKTTFADNNRILLQKAHLYNGRLQIADWATYSTPPNGWITPDGVHLTRSGTVAVTDFIADKVAEVVAGRTITPAFDAPPLCRVGISLRPGAHLNDVRCLEQYLRNRGLFSGTPDKIYDAATAAAVNRINALQGWSQQGIAGMGVLQTLGAWREPTARPFCSSARPLQSGNAGNDVSCLVRRLAAHGYHLLDNTTFTRSVHEAVVHYRSVIGASPGGVADRLVLTRLGIYRPPCRVRTTASLMPGHDNADVHCLRHFLTGLGYPTPTNTSVYDWVVRNNVRNIETWQRLPVDGVADQTFLRRIGAVTSAALSAPDHLPTADTAPPPTTAPPATTTAPPTHRRPVDHGAAHDRATGDHDHRAAGAGHDHDVGRFAHHDIAARRADDVSVGRCRYPTTSLLRTGDTMSRRGTPRPTTREDPWQRSPHGSSTRPTARPEPRSCSSSCPRSS